MWLYTIDAHSKKRYWLGEIFNVEVLNEEEAEEILSIYRKNGWFKEMEDQIKFSGAHEGGFSNYKGIKLFNIRYKPGDLKLNDPYFEFPKDHPITGQTRYSFTHFKDDFAVNNKDASDFVFLPPIHKETDEDKDDVKTSSYFRESKAIEITYLHKEISKGLTEKLRDIYGFENVTPEHSAGYGANRIDIVVNNKSNLIFYEIKTYSSIRTSIREALGQIMEYAFWANKNKAKELIVVTQPFIELNEVKTYFENIRNKFGIPIYYQSFDIESNVLSERM